MIDQINDSLKKICTKLSNGSWFGQDAFNYVVDVKLFCKFTNLNLGEIELIEELIPNSVVGSIEKSDLPKLLSEISECFRFSGDEGSHPNKKYLISTDFREDLGQLLKQTEILFSENLGISKFWLKEGHPFYPVYWDYAFIIKQTDRYFVLIGSSSD